MNPGDCLDPSPLAKPSGKDVIASTSEIWPERGAMSTWDAATYRERELCWRKTAEERPEERDRCLSNAEQYARLAVLIEISNSRDELIN
jgi:hypothetical protein